MLFSAAGEPTALPKSLKKPDLRGYFETGKREGKREQRGKRKGRK